jgi:hypothetical protein
MIDDMADLAVLTEIAERTFQMSFRGLGTSIASIAKCVHE